MSFLKFVFSINLPICFSNVFLFQENSRNFIVKANSLMKLSDSLEKEDILNFGHYIRYILKRNTVFEKNKV